MIKTPKNSDVDFSLPSLLSLISTDSEKNYDGGVGSRTPKKKEKKKNTFLFLKPKKKKKSKV